MSSWCFRVSSHHQPPLPVRKRDFAIQEPCFFSSHLRSLPTGVMQAQPPMACFSGSHLEFTETFPFPLSDLLQTAHDLPLRFRLNWIQFYRRHNQIFTISGGWDISTNICCTTNLGLECVFMKIICSDTFLYSKARYASVKRSSHHWRRPTG